MKSYALLAAFCLTLLGQEAIAKDPPLLSLSLEHFKDTASITDDPVKGTTAISTERGFVEHWGPLHTAWNDEFLKGVIDDNTGKKSFEIDLAMTYNGSGRIYKTANYQSLNGPESVPLTLVRKDTANCATGECMVTEHLAFPVEEQLLRRIAADYAPGKPALWTYRVLARGGPNYQGQFSNAEIAGLLAKIDGYTRPLAQAKSDAAPLPLEFGLSGLAVAPSAELPNRSGVLVVEVHSASVAQKAGIITGDIIYKFDANRVTSPRELQAAVAARIANSTAAIHLYRGTTEMELSAQF